MKHEARTCNIASAKFEFYYTKINIKVRAHADYGAYNEMEKMWHVEFYVWSHYFLIESFPFPFPSAALPLLISDDNPAPEPNGPRSVNSIPVANPLSRIYTPDSRTQSSSDKLLTRASLRRPIMLVIISMSRVTPTASPLESGR
ncbi:hypothetical protein BUE80_DR004862 [Diplocarpon rosae]|nr:hypothetical protein BUE80_DR004862 [Diplocarpon rosae]